MTKISAEGVYTGNLTASQITVGTLSADRIAAGSLTAEKLDAVSIRTELINADYVSGLNCSFMHGKIGGWGITFTSIYTSHIVLSSSDRSLMVYAADGMSGHKVKIYYNDDSDFGFSATNAGGKKIVQLGSTNRIAGWSLYEDSITKGSVSLGADGTISNTTKWKLHNDGSGQLASGNISWNAAGRVTFSDSVSLAWTAGINSITAVMGGAAYPKLTKITATGIYTGAISARQINVDSTLVVGGSSFNGSISVQDAMNNVKATLNRSGITAVGGRIGGWIINAETICAAAPASGHRIYLTSSGYMYNDNPNTGKDYWGLKQDGSATFGTGAISFAADGSGFLSRRNLSWDMSGNLIGKDATLEDIFMTGTFRSPFAAYDGSIHVGGGLSESELHDNLTMPGGGGLILASDFPWDAS